MNALSVMHISDLHFGAEDNSKVEALVAIARGRQPHLICLTGDIVDFPWPRNFRRAAKFFDEVSPFCNQNVLVVPGNHDAILPGLGLWLYDRCLRRPRRFCKYFADIEEGIDACVIGVDSTYLSLRHLNNVGKFTDSDALAFQEQVRGLKVKWGEPRFRRAVKIILLHHHPMPTLSARSEGMLYLKNSGKFLREVAQEKIDLVLHGHQHDPCYYSLNFNVGGDEPLVVLSAGTAAKNLKKERGFSAQTEIHFVSIHRDHLAVECLYYDIDNKEFAGLKRFPKKRLHDQFTRWEESDSYTITAIGDLEVKTVRKLRVASGESINEIIAAFGVDSRSQAASFAQLGFKCFRNGNELPAVTYQLKRDEPHRKTVAIKLDSPLEGMRLEEFMWTYTWPKGWRNLIEDGKDHGYMVMEHKRNVVRVEIIAHSSLRLGDLQVQYFDPERVKHLYKDDTSRRGFEIEEPPLYHTVRFDVSLTQL